MHRYKNFCRYISLFFSTIIFSEFFLDTLSHMIMYLISGQLYVSTVFRCHFQSFRTVRSGSTITLVDVALYFYIYHTKYIDMDIPIMY